jgi:hypothetical protein
MPPRFRSACIPACAVLAAALALSGADTQAGETWRFDRLDQLGAHSIATTGHPHLIETTIGQAVEFDGAGDAFQVDANPLAGADTFTLEITFRPEAGGGGTALLQLQKTGPGTAPAEPDRLLLGLRIVNGKWFLDAEVHTGAKAEVMLDRDSLHSLGGWHHAALVYDGRDLRAYVDGVGEASAALRLAPLPAGRVSIGPGVGRNAFKGAIFEARLTPQALAPAEFLSVPHFREHTVSTGLAGGYQVIAADLNHDGKPDLIALTTRGSELAWYENPTWERHTLATGFPHMINCVTVGADSEGIPEIVLASEFNNVAKNSLGVVTVLHHDGDPRRPWKATEIDRIPTSHRLRLADIDGRGKPVVIDAALTGPHAEPPDFRGQTPLVYYRPGIWKRETIEPRNSGLVHGIFILDWDGDGRDEILTAGFEGIHLFKLGTDGQWTRTAIAAGAPDPWPKSGSSDIAVGHLGRERFLAAIEPWHGNQVAIYRLRGGVWQRQVIDTSLADGHTIQTADFDGNGDDEVVAGYRGGGHNLYLYRYDRASGTWQRRTLDQGGMGAAACAVADLNGDGRPDIACIGSATANLKWYENLGPHP